MKVSYNWLKQYINCELSAEEIAKKLTGTGLEVEEIGRASCRERVSGHV